MSFQKTGVLLRFTVPSDACTTALLHAVAEILRNRVEVLHRDGLGQRNGAAFSKQAHDTYQCIPNLIAQGDAFASTPAISPFRTSDDEVREQTHNHAYVTFSWQAVIQRDAKGVRFTQMIVNEGAGRNQPTQLMHTPLRTIRNYKKRFLKHERGGLGNRRRSHRPQRSACGNGNRVKIGVTIEAVRRVLVRR